MLPAYYQAYMNNLLLIGTFVVHPSAGKQKENRQARYGPLVHFCFVAGTPVPERELRLYSQPVQQPSGHKVVNGH